MGKYLKTKEGSIESAVLEAMSPAQQAAIAISKKEKEKKEEEKLTDEELSAKQKKIDLNKNGKVDGDDLKKLRAKKDEEVDLDEKPADFIRLTFNNPADVKKAKKWMKDNLPGADQGFTGIDYRGKDIEFEDVDDAEDLMAKLKKAGFKFKIDYREEVSEAKGTYVGDTGMVERAAKHISDMWKEASKSPKKEEEDPKKKESKTTMTGKPMSGVEINPKSKED
jgi:hypothetical protein